MLQAIHCSLADVAPAGGGSEWSEKVSVYTFRKCLVLNENCDNTVIRAYHIADKLQCVRYVTQAVTLMTALYAKNLTVKVVGKLVPV